MVDGSVLIWISRASLISRSSRSRPVTGQDELLVFRVVQPDRGPLGAQHLAGRLADLLEHCAQVERGREATGDFEQLQEDFGPQRRRRSVSRWLHRASSSGRTLLL
jgi:hypothetical protein